MVTKIGVQDRLTRITDLTSSDPSGFVDQAKYGV